MVKKFLKNTFLATLIAAMSFTSCNNDLEEPEFNSKSMVHKVLYDGAEIGGLSFNLSTSKKEVAVNNYRAVEWNFDPVVSYKVYKTDEDSKDAHVEYFHPKGDVSYHKLHAIKDVLGKTELCSELIYGELSNEPVGVDFSFDFYGEEILVSAEGLFKLVGEDSNYVNFRLQEGKRFFKPARRNGNFRAHLPIPTDYFVEGIYEGLGNFDVPSFFEYTFSEACEHYKLNDRGSYDFKGTYEGTLDEIFAFEKKDFAVIDDDTLWSDLLTVVYDTNTYDFNLVVSGIVAGDGELRPSLEGAVVLDGVIEDRFDFQTKYVPIKGGYKSEFTILVDRYNDGFIDYAETLYRNIK